GSPRAAPAESIPSTRYATTSRQRIFFKPLSISRPLIRYQIAKRNTEKEKNNEKTALSVCKPAAGRHRAPRRQLQIRTLDGCRRLRSPENARGGMGGGYSYGKSPRQ